MYLSSGIQVTSVSGSYDYTAAACDSLQVTQSCQLPPFPYGFQVRGDRREPEPQRPILPGEHARANDIIALPPGSWSKPYSPRSNPFGERPSQRTPGARSFIRRLSTHSSLSGGDVTDCMAGKHFLTPSRGSLLYPSLDTLIPC